MSLDVYLIIKGETSTSSGIFIREGGQNKEITRAEWDARFPGQEPVVMNSGETGEVFSYNITHNLANMADAAGIYGPVWRPEENGITKAKHLIVPLANGLETLEKNRWELKKLNPANGWGDYEGLVQFIKTYLVACIQYPEANVGVSR